ncbi:pyridoxal phosphate-dependent aminotransferase [Desulfocurvus sp. DL9XJH121]
MRISRKLSAVKPSATLAVTGKAMELRAQGRKITSLSVGEPDFDTPQHICDAAKAAMDEGFTRYTQPGGMMELRAAGAQYFNTYYNTNADGDAVMFANGGKQVLYNIMQCYLEPGDKVLIPAPYWVSYPAMALLADAEPVIVPSGVEKGFKVSPEDLEAAYTPEVRMLILNSPSNPTGVLYSAEEMDALVDWAVSRKVLVISDEIYDRLVYSPAKPVSLAPAWEKHPEWIVIANGLSKSFAMTGWRVGFALGHPDLIKAMCKLQGQSAGGICSITQKAALAGLTGSHDFMAGRNAAFERRRDLCLEIMSTWPGVVCPKPEGAFYVFPDVSALFNDKMPDSTTMCTALLEEAGVAGVPGAAFGDDNCLRFSYAVDDEVLADALTRVGEVLLS